jgi:SNF2 family DNA or RNA helicase
MGLGKTIQAISYILSIRHAMGKLCDFLPFLVVAPLSTIENWRAEFATWAPDLNVVCYNGDKVSRDRIRDLEFFVDERDLESDSSSDDESSDSDRVRKPKKLRRTVKFDILLSSYEFILKDSKYLKGFDWESMIIDEGHRLKNEKGLSFQQLKEFKPRHIVLLTGTPMQNNIGELFTLLNFLDGRYVKEALEEKFSNLTGEEKVSELHTLLQPHILRRVKTDVLRELPEKVELIVPVSMTDLQRECYKAVLTKNSAALVQSNKRTMKVLNNVLNGLKIQVSDFLLTLLQAFTSA